MTAYDVDKAPSWLRDFVRESNQIENIKDTIGADIAAHQQLLDLTTVKVPDLEMFVRTITRDHVLRDKVGLDVRVGNHFPPHGCPEIRVQLTDLLFTLASRSPLENHLLYEALHPFTDGNGRSGRALWLWQMRTTDLNSRRERVTHESFLDIFRAQADKAGHVLFTAKRGLYYSVLAQGSK